MNKGVESSNTGYKGLAYIYALFKGLNHIQGLETELGVTCISGWRGTRYQTFKPFPFPNMRIYPFLTHLQY
jgi:hypothetical protein